MDWLFIGVLCAVVFTAFIYAILKISHDFDNNTHQNFMEEYGLDFDDEEYSKKYYDNES